MREPVRPRIVRMLAVPGPAGAPLLPAIAGHGRPGRVADDKLVLSVEQTQRLGLLNPYTQQARPLDGDHAGHGVSPVLGY